MQQGLFIRPDAESLRELTEAWEWLLPRGLQPIEFTWLGDVFFQDEEGAIHWLDVGVGELSAVASSEVEFRALLSSDQGRKWLLPHLLTALHEAGKVARPDECYAFVTPPVFAEGLYAVENLNVVPVREAYGVAGALHRQIRDLPDGASVRLVVE